jgi:hypothetical protein
MVISRHSKTLNNYWQMFGGIEAYMSIAMADFLNFFLLSRLNSISGHSSLVVLIKK